MTMDVFVNSVSEPVSSAREPVCCLFGGSDGSGLSPVVTVVQNKCPKVRICIAQEFARGLEM